jgi:hypothetical protein
MCGQNWEDAGHAVVTQLEAAINGRVSPELPAEAALLRPANAPPLLLDRGVLESLSLGGGRA